MLTEPMLDPTGAIVAEALSNATLNALIGGRFRAGEPAPKRINPDTGVVIYDGDGHGPGDYKAFVVLVLLDAPIHPQLPVSLATEYAVNCYGVTYQNALEVWRAFVATFHKVRSRTKASGLGIYGSTIVQGGSQDSDPDTKQPVVRGVLRVLHTASSVIPPGS